MNHFNYKHGDSCKSSPTHFIYSRWLDIKKRCTNSKFKFYHHYGGRGITVCDEWSSYQNFKSWYTSQLGWDNRSLEVDRENNDGNYCPENCRLATRSQQTRNKRNNRIFEFNGESGLLSDLSDKHPVGDTQRARSRMHMGWSLEDALTKPVRERHNEIGIGSNDANSKLRPISVYIRMDQYDSVLDIMKETKLNQSTVIRNLLDKGLGI